MYASTDSMTIRIKTTDKNHETPTYNIICDIHGTSDSKEFVLAGAHYEGHDIAQGAIDSGSGAATIIEMARVLHMVRDKLKRRIRLVCFGAEEIGLYGSRNYVAENPEEMDDIRFMLNLDAIGGRAERKGIVLNGQPTLETFVENVAAEMKAAAAKAVAEDKEQ